MSLKRSRSNDSSDVLRELRVVSFGLTGLTPDPAPLSVKDTLKRSFSAARELKRSKRVEKLNFRTSDGVVLRK